MTLKQLFIHSLATVGLISTAANAETIEINVPPTVRVNSSLAYPVMLEEADGEKNYLKISLIGEWIKAGIPDRSPVNVAIVIDRSGSMSGQSIEQAKQAALMAVDWLDSRDTLSVIGYDSDAVVIVPAQKLTDKESVKRRIRDNIYASGNTALFAGVSLGMRETERFFSKNNINRVILLSDGQANVGPSSVTELGELGRAAAKQGLTVSTIGLGLGYNEDLMTTLAGYSDGSHYFVDNASALEMAFSQEFDNVMNVAAQDVEIVITLHNGTPVRLLGNEGEIRGNQVRVNLNQVYFNQEKYALLEFAPDHYPQAARAEIQINYRDMISQKTEEITQSQDLRFSKSQQAVEESTDETVLADAYIQESNMANQQAIEAIDRGEYEQASAILGNAQSIFSSKTSSFRSDVAQEKVQMNVQALEDSQLVIEAAPEQARKSLRASEYQLKKNQ